jgi:hypothetical protein
MALGIAATGLRPEGLQDSVVRLDTLVRAAYRLVSVVTAKKDVALAAQIQPAGALTCR